MRTTRTLAATAALTAGAFVGLAAPANAAPPNQSGLVNVNVSNLAVQIPIGVAANICDVNAAVLATLGPDDAAACNTAADPDATLDITPATGPAGTQEGLVNVNVSDIAIQAPIAVVANVCDVNVAVLAQLTGDAAAPCNASGDPDSVITLG
jgi:hypothetical protein